MEAIFLDLRHGLRLLLRRPGFTALALGTLALGIGTSTAMFTVLRGVVLRPLDYRAPEELVFVNETSPDGTQMYSVSLPNFRDWRERNRSFAALSAFRAASFNLTGREGPVRVRGAMVSANFFETLGVEPVIGRGFDERDNGPGTEPVVLLSHGLWQARFGGRPDVVGARLVLDGRSFAVRGVLPEGFEFLTRSIELFMPIGQFRAELPWEERGSHPGLWVVGRLRPAIDRARAQEDMNRIAREIEREHAHEDEILVRWLHERVVGRARPSLLALMGAVTLLLLIACVNVANLLLVRALGRRREMAIRAALGAGKGRLLAQLVGESLLLASLGGLLGLLLASWGVELFRGLLPPGTPRLPGVELDAGAFVFAFSLSVGTGVVFGLAPMAHAKDNILSSSLRIAGGVGSSGSRLRAALVVAEIALAVLLLAGSGLLIKSFLHLSSIDTGFRTEDRLAVRIALPPGRYDNVEKATAFYRRLLDEVRALPGVELAAVATGLPLVDPGVEAGIVAEGVSYERENVTLASVQVVSRNYFRTMGIDLLEGRVFDARDGKRSPRVAVVDETLARRLFPGESALGKRLVFGSTPEEPGLVTIVGVVRHVLNYQLTSPQYVEVYVPLEQPPSFFTRLPTTALVVRSASAPDGVFASLREAVGGVDPAQPVFGAITLERIVDESLARERANSILVSTFAAFALILAAVGLYGVLSSIVGQRTREVGLRMALGATPSGILRSVVGEGLGLAIAGAGLGIFAALAVQRALRHLFYGVGLLELDVLAASSTVALLATLVASAIPARRATRVDVVSALRHE